MRICDFEGCEYQHRANGWCAGHNKQFKTGKGMTPLRQRGRLCGVEGCVRPHSANGLCNMHFMRHRKSGDTGTVDPVIQKGSPDYNRVKLGKLFEQGDYVEAMDLLKSFIDPVNDCWIWPYPDNKDGYGALTYWHLNRSQTVRIHRLVGAMVFGREAINGLPIHHSCANKKCCNPEHLRPVTQYDNNAEMLSRKYYVDRIAALEAEVASLRAQLGVSP